MKQVYLKLLLVWLVFACQNQDRSRSNEIVIDGQVQNVPDGRIYLAEAHDWQTPLYWTNCKDGRFTFKIRPDSSFVPFLASIYYPDSSKRTKISSLFFRNHMVGADSLKNSSNSFFVEQGRTRLEGDPKNSPFVRVFAGRETDLLYKLNQPGFGSPGNPDQATRTKRIAYIKNKIRQHPYSYLLLQGIYANKEQYTEDELREILPLFDDDVQRSSLGRQINAYLATRTDPGQHHPNLLLVSSTNQRRLIFDSTAKVTMLIFWASWCRPCRQEIPVLKEIQEEYSGKGLRMASISIDDSKSNWLKAVEQEKMPWQQFVVDADKKEQVHQQFNFRAIPLIVLTDNKGKEIQRFAGYSEEGKKEYQAALSQIID